MKLSKKYNVTLKDVIRYALRPKDLTEVNNDKDNNMNDKKRIASAAVCGFITGFAGAIMFTPESGAALRQHLAQFFEETNEKLGHFISETISNTISTKIA